MASLPSPIARDARWNHPPYSLFDECYDEVKGSWDERFESTLRLLARCHRRCRLRLPRLRYLRSRLRSGRLPRVSRRVSGRLLLSETGVLSLVRRQAWSAFGEFLAEEVLEDVGHCLWTFTIPRMLRPYFRHHRHLLGELSKAAWEAVRELMAAAVGDPEFRPGMISVVQSLGDILGWHPQVHTIASRGGWAADGSFTPVPFVDAKAAEQLFRHKVITLLRDEGLLTEEHIELLLSWRHSGFSALVPICRLAHAVGLDSSLLSRLSRHKAWATCARESGETPRDAKETVPTGAASPRLRPPVLARGHRPRGPGGQRRHRRHPRRGLLRLCFSPSTAATSTSSPPDRSATGRRRGRTCSVSTRRSRQSPSSTAR